MRSRVLTQIFRFGVIGGLAFIMHWLCVVMLVSICEIHPLKANVFGFISAFCVSYLGHRNWTFSDIHADQVSQNPHRQSLRRFILVALLGFTLNEICYAFLLNFSTLDFRLSLLFSIATASLSTYFLSKYWAFNGI